MKTQKLIRRSIKIAQTQIGKSFLLRASKKQNHESHPFKCIKYPIRYSIRFPFNSSSYVNTSINQSKNKNRKTNLEIGRRMLTSGSINALRFLSRRPAFGHGEKTKSSREESEKAGRKAAGSFM